MKYNFQNLYDRAEVMTSELEQTDRRAYLGTVRDLVECARLLERMLKSYSTMRCDLAITKDDLDAILDAAKETIGEAP